MRDRFRGVLLGTLLGDAVGAPWEGASAGRIAAICAAYPTLPRGEQEMNRAIFGLLLTDTLPAPVRYTDDTQMTLAVAETLTQSGLALRERQDTDFEAALASQFADVFDPMRGYGPAAHAILRELRQGAAWHEPASRVFGGKGSFGNGAAMRVAPAGVFFHAADTAVLQDVARRSALPTHTHPLGIAGAILQAQAVAVACRTPNPLDPLRFLADVENALGSDDAMTVYRGACEKIRQLLSLRPSPDVISDVLGSDITAQDSVPAALYAFLAHPDDFRAAVTFAVRIGNDTDTVAAMCGAISGAFLGASALPAPWLAAVENGWQGRDHAQDLADRLYATWQ